MGESGCGKRVVMKCMVGLVRGEWGEIVYEGGKVVDMGKGEKKGVRGEMGMIFERGGLFEWVCVVENVMFGVDMFWNES